MKLMYIWTDGYKVLQEGGFNFSREFNFDYDSKNNTITIQKNRDYNQFKEENNIDLFCIVGKNGSGKSTLLELIGEFEKFVFFKPKLKTDYPNKYIVIYLNDNNIFIYSSNKKLKVKDLEKDIYLVTVKEENNECIMEFEVDNQKHNVYINAKVIFKNPTSYIFYEGHFAEGSYNRESKWTNNLSTNYLIKKAENVSEYISNEDLKQLNFIVGLNDLDSNEEKFLIYQAIKSRLKKVKIVISKEKLKKEIYELYEKDFPEFKEEVQTEYNLDNQVQQNEFKMDFLNKKLLENEELIKKNEGDHKKSVYYKIIEILNKKSEENEFKDYFLKSMIVSLFLEYKKDLTKKSAYDKLCKKIKVDSIILDVYKELIHITNNDNKINIKDIDEKLMNLEVKEITITENNEIEIEIEVKKIEELLRDYFSFNPNKKNKMINISWIGISNGEYEFLKLYSRFYDIGYELEKYYELTIEEMIKSKNKQDNPFPGMVVVLFDEIDLTFHPEWQRKLIEEIKFINKCLDPKYKKRIGQIIITTHSPIMLSDFPAENVIFLDDGKSIKSEIETFGQNIHTLFKSGFFLENTIGEFANEKIKKVIEDLTYKTREELENDLNRKKEIEYIISIIGEPIIKRKLELMYKEIFPENIEDYEMKIKKLEEEKQNLLKELKSKIGDKND